MVDFSSRREEGRVGGRSGGEEERRDGMARTESVRARVRSARWGPGGEVGRSVDTHRVAANGVDTEKTMVGLTWQVYQWFFLRASLKV